MIGVFLLLELFSDCQPPIYLLRAKVTWHWLPWCRFGFLYDVWLDGCLKEAFSWKMDSMRFREDNSTRSRVQLKRKMISLYYQSLPEYGLINTDSMTVQLLATFLPEEMFEEVLWRSAWEGIFWNFYVIDEGLMWDSVRKSWSQTAEG